MDAIDAAFPGVKDRIGLTQEIAALCDRAGIKVRDDRTGRGKGRVNHVEQLSARLTNDLSDAREKADQQKEQMKTKIAKKVPRLNAMCKIF